ncbi:MAG: tRNA(Ile)-lysidine synthase [Phycisphaerae bacterium]|nr:tRNA(Ile)-lysidine synthase [Phycisphaerae bacterium]
MNWDRCIDHLRDWLAQRGLLAPGAVWVVGVSGGPDSTLLLRSLVRLSQRDNLYWSLHAGHLNHALRGTDSDDDARAVQALADELRIAAHVERVDVPGRVAADGGSTEQVARRYRYEFLERVALRAGSDRVAVAHHADDQAETILHRVCRGTGLRGLGGMADVRPLRPGAAIMLVRPFLQFRRELIERICAAEGFATRMDSSNDTAQFTRGRIRNVVLPLMREQINPNVSEALLRLAEQARWLGSYLEDAAARTFDTIAVSDGHGEIVLNTRAFLAKQRIIQAELVRRAASLLCGREMDLSFTHVESVLNLAADRASGKEVHLPGPVVVRKRYERLTFQLGGGDDDEPVELRPQTVACPGVTMLPALRAELTAELYPFDPAKIAELRTRPHPGEEWIDLDRVRLPLFIRGRRDGDRFWPLGAPGAKTLSEFFTEHKIEPQLRARAGILCDQEGPVWVMPLRIDDRVRLRESTARALRLILRPVGPGPATIGA